MITRLQNGIKTPNILYLKRNCLDDGPGIRTTVFFKGCPLSCVWCHNPESQSIHTELSYDRDKCLGCDECANVCLLNAISHDNPHKIDRLKCNLCFECVEICPSMALAKLGSTMSIPEIIDNILKDAPFYSTSGGGVTVSGGEPTLFMEFCSELLAECSKREIHTLIETCGMFDFDRFRGLIYPYLKMIFFDIKLIDSADHLRYCGVGNEKILDNFRKLALCSSDGGVSILPRIPLIPGITATDENLSGISQFLKSINIFRISLLPYNPTWTGKPAMTGGIISYIGNSWMPKEEIERCHEHFDGFEIL